MACVSEWSILGYPSIFDSLTFIWKVVILSFKSKYFKQTWHKLTKLYAKFEYLDMIKQFVLVFLVSLLIFLITLIVYDNLLVVLENNVNIGHSDLYVKWKNLIFFGLKYMHYSSHLSELETASVV